MRMTAFVVSVVYALQPTAFCGVSVVLHPLLAYMIPCRQSPEVGPVGNSGEVVTIDNNQPQIGFVCFAAA